MNENFDKIIIDEENYTVRPWNFEEDHEKVGKLLDIVFEDILQKKGLAVKTIFEEYKTLYPFIKILSLFDKNYKHVLDGFVIENEKGQIVASVNVGYSMGNKYEIAMVATHPDYRRKGFARKLVNLAIDHTKNLGAKICALEVLDINEPAYNLYKNLGFIHFDSTTRQKLQSEKLKEISMITLPKEYESRSLNRNKKNNLERYELDLLVTPKEVQDFVPVRRSKYQRPLLIRIIRPFARLIIKPKSKTWMIYMEDSLVGTINVNIGRKEGKPHRLEMMIHPKHSGKLAEPILTMGLDFIKENDEFNQNTIVEFRSSELEQKKACEKYGFITVETMHLLGLKL